MEQPERQDTNWFKKNKQWFFSGIGGVILTLIVTLFLTLKTTPDKGVSIGGNVKSGGDTAISEKGNINIEKNVSDNSVKVNVSGGGNAIIQGDNSKVIYGIPPEQYAEELGVTKGAIKNFFKIMEKKQVPPEDLDNTLRQIAKRHKDLQERLKQFKYLVDPEVEQLREQAEKAIASGKYDEADSYLDKAIEKQLVCVRRLEKQTKECRLSAAEMKADKAEMQMIQINYKTAAKLFKEAAGLVPDDEGLIKAKYLQYWGNASYKTGEYKEAEKPLRRSLKIREKLLGPDNTNIALSLNELALLLKSQGKYEESEPLYKKSLEIRETKNHPDVAESLNNLAGLYYSQGKYAEAEPLYQRSLGIVEKALGKDHPDVAKPLNNLAELYRAQGKYAEAEPLYQRSLGIRETKLGKDHPEVAASLNNLAGLYYHQKKYKEAVSLFERVLVIFEKSLGKDHPYVAKPLNNLAEMYRSQGKYAKAEPLYQRSLGIVEKALGKDHPDVATALNNLALLYKSQGKYEKAVSIFKRVLIIFEKSLGKDHPNYKTAIKNYHLILEKFKQKN